MFVELQCQCHVSVCVSVYPMAVDVKPFEQMRFGVDAGVFFPVFMFCVSIDGISQILSAQFTAWGLFASHQGHNGRLFRSGSISHF